MTIEDILSIIEDFKCGQIVHESDLENELLNLTKEDLAQFIRLMATKGVFNDVL